MKLTLPLFMELRVRLGYFSKKYVLLLLISLLLLFIYDCIYLFLWTYCSYHLIQLRGEMGLQRFSEWFIFLKKNLNQVKKNVNVSSVKVEYKVAVDIFIGVAVRLDVDFFAAWVQRGHLPALELLSKLLLSNALQVECWCHPNCRLLCFYIIMMSLFWCQMASLQFSIARWSCLCTIY